MQSFTSSSRGSTTGYITLRANRVLQGAAEEADRLNDDFISTEHLLLAIAYERGGANGPHPQRSRHRPGEDLRRAARDPRRPPCDRPNPEEHYEALERFSVDLTKAAVKASLTRYRARGRNPARDAGACSPH